MRLTEPRVTINYTQDVRYTKKKGTFPVKMRVTYRGERMYYNTNIELTREDFEKVKEGSPRGRLLDVKFRLDKEMVRAQKVVDTMQTFNFSEFKRLVGIRGKHRSLSWYFNDYIHVLKKEGRLTTVNSYQTAFNVLSKYYGNKFAFHHLSPILLEEFEDHYEEEGKSMGTVGLYMRSLRTIYNRALKDGTISRFDYPFGKGKYIIPSARKRKVGVPLEVIKVINSYQFEDPYQRFHRDLWMFSFHCNGMNMRDIAFLKYKNIQGSTLSYVRGKTKRTRKRQQLKIVVHLNAMAKDIIERWGNEKESTNTFVFPILNDSMNDQERIKRYKQENQNVRKLVQRIKEAEGWEFPLDFQSARHSFSNLLQKNDEPLHVIQQALGHSDPNITLHYLSDLEEEKRKNISSLTNFTS